MFLDPPGAKRVQTDSEKEAEQHKTKCFRSEENPQRNIECKLRNPVENHPTVNRFYFFQTKGSSELKKWKHEQPECFSKCRVVDQFRLPEIRKIGIQLVNSLE